MLLDSFFPYVLPEVIGCPEPMLKMQLLLSASEFCRETLAWTEQQDSTPLANGVSDYELEMPSQAYALTVRDVWLGGRRLRPMTMHALQDVMPNWATAESNEPIYYNASVERGSIRVFPVPANVIGSLSIRASFIPIMTATTLPDFLASRHMEVIAAGAKSRLMLMNGAPWSNPAMGAYYRQLANDGIVSARVEEAHDRVPGSVTVRPRSFGF